MRRREHGLTFAAATSIALLMAMFVLLAMSPSRPAFAQDAIPASLQQRSGMSPQEQARLRETLAHNVSILEAQAAVVKTVAKLIGPAVVHIEADVTKEPRTTYEQGRKVEEAGSGVIVRLGDRDYVLTNRHVIEKSTPEGIKINLADGRRLHPIKVLTDPDTDVAVMAVAAPHLVTAEIGNSEKVEIGDFVLAVGSPFGLSHSVTFGIISAKGRRDLRLGDSSVRFQDFMQTDAAINPGNSGGPLVNLHGEVIGINTAIASNSGGNEGIGFSIPINMFMIIAEQLIEHGKVTRAFLGVNLDAQFGPGAAAKLGLPCPTGAHVTGITKGAPAEAADIRVGDVILEFNHIPVDDDAHLVNLVSLTKVGTRVPVLVWREQKPKTIEVEVGDRSKFQ